MRTIAVIALKGGSGKTTVATHLALAAHRRGLDTLVVDLDPQHSASDVRAARDVPRPAARDVWPAGEDPRPPCIVSTGPKLLSAQFAAVGLRKDLMVVDTAA